MANTVSSSGGLSSSSSTARQISNTLQTTTKTVAATQQQSTVPITTTFTTSSLRCVATLEGQVLTDGATALVIQNGTFITLNNTCHSVTASPTSLNMATATLNSTVSSNKQHNDAVSPGIIAGLVIGILAVLACLGGVAFWLWYRRRSSTSIFTLKAKTLDDEDCSREVPIRWEKDSAEIKESDSVEITESDSAEIKEMSAGPPPVEMGDGRSIKEPDLPPMSPVVASPISIMTMDSFTHGLEDTISPLSPK